MSFDEPAKVSVSDNFDISVSFTDITTGDRVSGQLDKSGARELLSALLMRFYPGAEEIRVILCRYGLVVINDDALEKRFNFADRFPETFRGFYIHKTNEGKWMFGRAKGGALYWEETELNDLLDLGIKVDDLVNVISGVDYRLPFVAVLRR